MSMEPRSHGATTTYLLAALELAGPNSLAIGAGASRRADPRPGGAVTASWLQLGDRADQEQAPLRREVLEMSGLAAKGLAARGCGLAARASLGCRR